MAGGLDPRWGGLAQAERGQPGARPTHRRGLDRVGSQLVRSIGQESGYGRAALQGKLAVNGERASERDTPEAESGLGSPEVPGTDLEVPQNRPK